MDIVDAIRMYVCMCVYTYYKQTSVCVTKIVAKYYTYNSQNANSSLVLDQNETAAALERHHCPVLRSSGSVMGAGGGGWCALFGNIGRFLEFIHKKGRLKIRN